MASVQVIALDISKKKKGKVFNFVIDCGIRRIYFRMYDDYSVEEIMNIPK